MLVLFLYIGFSRFLEVVYISSLALMGAVLGGDMGSAVPGNLPPDPQPVFAGIQRDGNSGLDPVHGSAWHAISGLRLVRRIMKGVNQDLVMIANCLCAAWILFLSASMFASVAYHLQVTMLLGFSYALRTAALAQLANRRVAARLAAARTGFGIPQPALR